MKYRLISLLLLLSLLTSCAPSPSVNGDETMTVVTTTYPVYLFASAVTKDMEGIRVERLNTGSVSCLHDYTLSMTDMKKIEQADVIAMSGVELEEFMQDALAASDAAVIDCSVGAHLLENLSHHHREEDGEEEHGHEHGHDHGHWDPHYWMDPENAVIMVENLLAGLSQADSARAEEYRANALSALALLEDWKSTFSDLLLKAAEEKGGFSVNGLITFHDGFQYFAHAFDLPLLESIEEEAGSEASAKEIVEITQLVNEHRIPVIFTEVNGSDATAKAIARETGCRVAQLSMVMDGPDDQLSRYYDAMMGNLTAVIGGFSGEEMTA